ncbi:hypothetical protein H6P81_002285 [Aristolochia fimbriata]|uniref:Uncharacterized protein n=1 Tax=Aristolochia fimbriata TaxID=158543 RepID=A0AAV7F9D6_ARIFI|nr:hypothetical protein H6P81_002285 [Aristolochia fimbriata]
MVGINIRPRSSVEHAAYTVGPGNGYFEFIPHSDDGFLGEEPQPVPLTQVRVGELYEVVVTNYSGLYRYRMGDIVKVSGFYNSMPDLQFVRRKNVVLSVLSDKTTEVDLLRATESASNLYLTGEEVEILDFTSYGDLSTDPPHYVIFWELSDRVSSEEILQKCCNCLDRSFAESCYNTVRKNGSIGPPELRIVAQGTFTKICEYYQSLGSSIIQFKTPRCITRSNTPMLKILEDNVIARFFSTMYENQK